MILARPSRDYNRNKGSICLPLFKKQTLYTACISVTLGGSYFVQRWRNTNNSRACERLKLSANGHNNSQDCWPNTGAHPAQHCWEWLHRFPHHCQHARNNSLHCWPNIVGSCCIRLNTTTNTHATTPYTVGPTMLGLVASVYTWLKV